MNSWMKGEPHYHHFYHLQVGEFVWITLHFAKVCTKGHEKEKVTTCGCRACDDMRRREYFRRKRYDAPYT